MLIFWENNQIQCQESSYFLICYQLPLLWSYEQQGHFENIFYKIPLRQTKTKYIFINVMQLVSQINLLQRQLPVLELQGVHDWSRMGSF